MEPRELELIDKYSEKNAQLKTLWEEHLLYEKQLDKLEKKPFLTPAEDQVVRDIKKKKLAGKTKMQAILDRYKNLEE